MKKSSTLTPARTRNYAALVALLTLTAVAVSGCATRAFQIVRDGGGSVVVSSSLICPGTKFQLIISQASVGSSVVDVEARDDKIRFEGSALDRFDFTQPVTITVIVKQAGPDCDAAALAVGRAFEARDVTPRPVAGERRTFEVRAGQFRAKPQ
jgi:hypothetical protein